MHSNGRSDERTDGWIDVGWATTRTQNMQKHISHAALMHAHCARTMCSYRLDPLCVCVCVSRRLSMCITFINFDDSRTSQRPRAPTF